MSDTELIKRIENIEKDIFILKGNLKDKTERVETYVEKIRKVNDLCYNKIHEYEEYRKLFGDEEEITKRIKIERDLAQQIYTILF